MATALSGTIRLRLEHTLAQWRHWDASAPLTSKPEIIGELGAGLSNCSVLVEARQRFVVRIDGINPTQHGLNRQAEWHSLNIAHQQGLAPRPCYFNPELGALVSEYLSPDELQPVNIAEIAGLLHRIHQLPARHHRLDLPERIRRYEKIMQQRDHSCLALSELQPQINTLLDWLENQVQPMVLCHNDLLQANRIYSSGTLFALDWEYCAMGSAWYDLAVVAVGDELTPDNVQQLVASYHAGQGIADSLILVSRYACIYGYLEYLWYRIENLPGVKSAFLETKLGSLREKLAEQPL